MMKRRIAIASATFCLLAGCAAGMSDGETDDDGNGGGGLDGGAGGEGGGEAPLCSGHELTKSGALDLDVKHITVSGAVTLNGDTLPDTPGDRGAIQLIERFTGDSVELRLGNSGAGAYQVSLAPGQYDVVYSGHSGECAGPMPCNDGRIVRDLELNTSGAFDIDIAAVTVNGSITVNGETMPSFSSNRGTLGFERAEDVGDDHTGLVELDALGSTGAASYAATLLAGSYTVHWLGSANNCTTVPAAPVPCNSGPVIGAVDLGSSGALDVDVTAATITGSVTARGNPFPTTSFDRGALTFSLEGGLPVSTERFGQVGAASYAITVLHGTYDVGFDGNGSQCGEIPAPPLPCNRGIIDAARTVNGAGVLDYDLTPVTVSGTVSVNGGAIPTNDEDRGSITFARDGGSADFDLGASGPTTYALTLLAGTYDVLWNGRASLCERDTPQPTPCNDGPLLTGTSLTSDGALDVDVPAVSVTGTVTVGGQPMDPADLDRGAVTFELASDDDTNSVVETAWFGSTGAPTFGVTVLSGTYAIGYVGNEELCEQPDAPNIPCNRGTVMTETSLTTSGALDVDLTAVRIAGNVTLNGAALPELDRGALGIRRLDDGEIRTSFTGVDNSTYAVTLLSGAYVFSHLSEAEICDGSAASPTPCVNQVLIGCP